MYTHTDDQKEKCLCILLTMCFNIPPYFTDIKTRFGFLEFFFLSKHKGNKQKHCISGIDISILEKYYICIGLLTYTYICVSVYIFF